VERARDTGTRTLWGPAALALLALAGLLWARHDRRSVAPETRIYLGLREACSRRGVSVTPGLTPLALVERIRQEGSGAADAASEVVDLYLRARYGRQPLGQAELGLMRRALGEARRNLRSKA